MSIDDDIAVLEQVPLLRALGRNAVRTLALGVEIQELKPGEVLFRPGDRIDCAYVVQDGIFALSTDPIEPGKVIEVGPGTLLGEFALVAGAATQPLTATAQGTAVVIRVSRSMFLRILEDDAAAAIRLRDYVAQRARQSVSDILSVRDMLDPGER